ncbi:hypothetical protein [Streptosporangium sp. KLBMP 9127]|nr:hypothetical protein [Streptosporangium sp. KLBMP 9127]
MPVPRQSFDAERRAAATHLDLIEPYWVVWYGAGSRRFYAVPVWDCPGPPIVESRDIQDLVDQMRAAEDASRVAAR